MTLVVYWIPYFPKWTCLFCSYMQKALYIQVLLGRPLQDHLLVDVFSYEEDNAIDGSYKLLSGVAWKYWIATRSIPIWSLFLHLNLYLSFQIHLCNQPYFYLFLFCATMICWKSGDCISQLISVQDSIYLIFSAGKIVPSTLPDVWKNVKEARFMGGNSIAVFLDGLKGCCKVLQC